MTPTNWSYSPDAAKAAWRRWRKVTAMDITSEAFMAGALWALSQNGQQALVDEVRELRRQASSWRKELYTVGRVR